ncbi:MAG TPA: potassium transporter TrkG [Bauldia sp.]|nr:potassium transporter TrkG [Bauldia sp.]
MLGVFYLLSQALAGFAAALLLPAGIGFATGETDTANAFLLMAALLGFVAAAVIFALRGRTPKIRRVEGFMLVVAVWTIPSLVAAVPMMRAGNLDFLTALFESVSGLTTTGATALSTVRSVGLAGIFFRAELQWLGGLLTLATIATVVAASGLGGLSGSQVALLSGGEDRFGRLVTTLRQILVAYGMLTIACVVLLFASGIPPFEAVCIALSTISTGGFMPIDGSFAVYDNPFANGVVGVFMLIGATSVVWHRMVVEGRWQLLRAHRESYWIIGVALLVSFAYAVLFADPLRDAAVAPPHWITGGLLTGVSLVSTTGFQAHPSAMTVLPAAIVLFLAFVGGSGISTSGGIKFYRVGALLTLSGQELRRLIYPHSVRESRFGSVAFDPETLKAILSGLFVSLVTIVVALVLLSVSLPDFNAALTAAISGFSNIGPLYAAGWSEGALWPPYSDFDGFAKLVFIVTMILGRLEVLVVLAAFNLAYWRS